ncbi:aspartate/glutamate racemase family protein [[Flexibacter] sp. ATCC 35103]|uniref:aspartate/glutamate racemase family protein n=1 Tax=[Flexibacter] sp. ATCC 35103 TaxID=1937528 RepID=UPI0009C3098E|nr:amino acid racemase [[Flexibacter] sp. ATCC 35103]AQX14473.1 Asp/Glu racemase [[Flexibacter] sp. ATCC 35103]OMQ08256.1 hypothetical protein BXU01_21680 [[Flexibacter] sp. ATCC 35103]
MKKIGIISGMGTKAGLEFLNKFISRISADNDQDFPEFIFHNNSSIPDRTKSILNIGPSPIEELRRSLSLISDYRVDYIVSTCITSYHFLNQIEDSYSGNLINPFELIIEKLKNNFPQVQKIGLLATTGTLKSKMFERAFEDLSFEIITLDGYYQEEKFMKSVYMNGGFKSSHTTAEAHELFSDAVDKLIELGADLIIGACTETQFGMANKKIHIPYIDIVDLLVGEIIDLIYNTVENEQ